MGKRFIYILLLVIPVLAFAQSRDTVFTVKAPLSTVQLYPKTDMLYQNISKRFKLVKSPTFKLDTILFTGGTYQLKDSILILKATKSKTVLLRIFEKTADGRSVLALVQEFGVQKFVEPKPNLDGVDCDSAIYKMKAVAQGYVNVPKRPDAELKRFSYQVLSFEMLLNGVNKLDTLEAEGNRMTYKMRDEVDKMKDGSLIEITNIRYVIQDDTFTMRQPLRVLVLDGTITKF